MLLSLLVTKQTIGWDDRALDSENIVCGAPGEEKRLQDKGTVPHHPFLLCFPSIILRGSGGQVGRSEQPRTRSFFRKFTLLVLALCGSALSAQTPTATNQPADTGQFRLQKFEQAIGEETYTL